MKLTRYGLPQAVVFPCLAAGLCAASVFFLRGAVRWLAVFVCFALFIWLLSFFRDPARRISKDESVLLSPCDGTVTELTREGDCTKVSVFLSLFNVHINRVPCSVRIDSIVYKKGEYRDARDPEAWKVNESNDIVMTRTAEPRDVITVRQVSGAVARHIVCAAKPGESYEQGAQFGMIKFGSRTELILVTAHKHTVSVSVGDKVRAGITPMIKYIPGDVS